METLSAIVEVGFTWDGAPVQADERVRITLQPERDALLVEVEAPFHGDPAPGAEPGPTAGLWDYEVVELFVAGLAPRGKPTPYLEIELGPWGHHLVLDLMGVRNPIRTEIPIEYVARRLGSRWHGSARIPWRMLPARPARFNAYAIHGLGEGRRYLAMTPVPGPHPDFHRLHCFSPWPLR
ncbi:MAG: hypothetical protein H6737_00350 [Alphaproteobacteria bacterium]|nr:hypothetical protein [Alphaproteobacteria bacterium]